MQPIVPEVYWVEFLDGEGNRYVATGEFDGERTLVGGDDAPLAIDVSFEDGVIDISAIVRARARIEACTVYLRHEFASDERIVCNGYQSWTDTHEHTPHSVMRGIDRVPQGIVDRWALDGSGDYRFVSYDETPGSLHGFTYASLADAQGDATALVASLDESHGFTLIRLECASGTLSLETEPPLAQLEPGDTLSLCRAAIAYGTMDEAFDRWFALMGVRPRPSAPLIGYTSWYRHYDDIDAGKIALDLASTFRALANVDAPGATRLFQIDDGYCRIGDWLDVDPAKFPLGLAPLAAWARELDLLPGLWLAPFVCERDSRLAREHPGWLLRDERGEAVATGSHWTGGLALDILNPEVRAYVRDVVGTVVNEWGFGLLKLDFLYGACMLPHGELNRGELMADGAALLREAAGDECLLLGCGIPLASAFGRFEYCRIGCDVGLDWNDLPYMRLLHRERVSTRNSLFDTIFREPLDGRAFRNDPDVFFLRDDIRLSRRQRQLLLETDCANASVLLTSDDMELWGEEERTAYNEAITAMLARAERIRGERGR